MRVTFCGHKEVSDVEKVKAWLTKNLESLIRNGADTFYIGGYGAFDKLAANVICELKYKYPLIKSYLVLPYINKKFDLSKYDGTIYPDLEKLPMFYMVGVVLHKLLNTHKREINKLFYMKI